MSRYIYFLLLLVASVNANVYPDPGSANQGYLEQAISLLSDGIESLKNTVNAIATQVDDAFNSIMLRLGDLNNDVNASSIYDAEWQSWSMLTSCSATCSRPGSNGNGVRERHRQCAFVLPVTTNKAPKCEGNSTEVQPCSSSVTCPQPSSRYFGGSGGHTFNDEYVAANGNITGVKLQCGENLVSIQFRYGDVWGDNHGWMVGRYPCGDYRNDEERQFEFRPNEFISRIDISYGRFIGSVNFITNERALGACGTSSGARTRTLQAQGKLQYISGRAGCIIDGIKFYWSG